MLKVRWSLLFVLAAALLTFAACADDEGDADQNGETAATATATGTAADGDATATATDDEAAGDAGADGTSVEVSLVEWAVEAPASAPAGEVTFVASNDGSSPHELVVIRSDEPVDGLPTENAVVPEEEVDLIGEVEEFPAGETREGTFQLDAGRYLLICNIAGHYDLGMRTEFTVE